MTVSSDRIKEKRLWCVVTVVVLLAVMEVASLNGPNVCMVKQKYNITKRVKYRAPMSIRTYVWCFSMPPRCSKWTTEMRDLTRLETEERTAEVAVCCPGYKMKDVSCVPICPHGKMGHGCSEDCPPGKWGPNCVQDCPICDHGTCSPITGTCSCDDGWQGESCSISMPSTPSPTTMTEEILTTAQPTTKTTIKTTAKPSETTTRTTFTETTVPTTTPMKIVFSTTTVSPPTTTSTTLITTKLDITTSTIPTKEYINATIIPEWTTQSNDMLKVPNNIAISSNYNRTETPIENSREVTSTDITDIKTSASVVNSSVTFIYNTTSTTLPTITTLPSITTTTATTTTATTYLIKLTVKETATKTESPKKPETTVKVTTTKSKPKEIWIRPTQRGESPLTETKIKTNLEHYNRSRSATKKEEVSEFTTPRTIIVSIIPTSVSYITFKKIALTTASYISQKNISLQQQPKNMNKTEKAVTMPLSTEQTSTLMPLTIRTLSTLLSKNMTLSTTMSPLLQKNITKTNTPKFKEISNTTKIPSTNKVLTNSMTITTNAANKELNSSNNLTTTSPSTNNRKPTQGLKTYKTISPFSATTSLIRQTNSGIGTKYETNSKSPITATSIESKPVLSTTKLIKHYHSEKQRNFTVKAGTIPPKTEEVLAKTTKLLAIKHLQKTNVTKKNVTEISTTKNNVTSTAGPIEDETFHILTEPEHITAVMNDKGSDHTTVDLISVISIAGGVMMAVITVAVIIVMIERCKRPRYEDVRKINDIRMQVMIDNNDVPPPYVRSIFHTPLPDPPTSDKCHYQPISTLDRNLKQFMRPVVVQAISPIMLENFRGILECHYDHLPQRNYDSGTISTRCSITPSMACTEKLLSERAHSVTDYTIESLRREAKLDVIDNTTSEPLYAEIPCWRPPSEHAIEVLNLNGEAVTEL